jgi:hypothetical protein
MSSLSHDLAGLKAPTATDADYARLAKLLAAKTRKPAEIEELSALLQKCKFGPDTDDLPVEQRGEVLGAVIAEASRLEAELAAEPAARKAEDKAQQAEAAARKKIVDEILRLQLVLRSNDFEECQRFNAARDRVRVLGLLRGQLETTRHRWPKLFSLPAGTRRLTSEFLPDRLEDVLSQSGINLY